MIIQAPVAMAIFRGPDHVVEVVNTKVLELWGKTEEESLNKPIFEVLPEAGKQGLKQLMYDVYSTGERFTANELPVTLYRDGKVETVYVNFVYESIMKGDPVNAGVLSVAIDVTEQVHARQKVEEVVLQLGEANTKLEKSNAELAEFAYIASHDLQVLIRKISTFTQMLEHNIADINDKSKDYISKIYNSTDRMSTLVRDVLAFSRVNASVDFESVELNAIITAVKIDYELVIDETNATIETTILPKVNAISSQMIQLFGNLMSNALKYRKPGESPSIAISSEVVKDSDLIHRFGLDQKKKYYHIRFSDKGIGFHLDQVDKIFRIFNAYMERRITLERG